MRAAAWAPWPVRGLEVKGPEWCARCGGCGFLVQPRQCCPRCLGTGYSKAERARRAAEERKFAARESVRRERERRILEGEIDGDDPEASR